MTSYPYGPTKSHHFIQPPAKSLEKLRDPSMKVADWMAAALEDDTVCGLMKADIQEWLAAFPKEWMK